MLCAESCVWRSIVAIRLRDFRCRKFDRTLEVLKAKSESVAKNLDCGIVIETDRGQVVVYLTRVAGTRLSAKNAH